MAQIHFNSLNFVVKNYYIPYCWYRICSLAYTFHFHHRYFVSMPIQDYFNTTLHIDRYYLSGCSHKQLFVLHSNNGFSQSITVSHNVTPPHPAPLPTPQFTSHCSGTSSIWFPHNHLNLCVWNVCSHSCGHEFGWRSARIIAPIHHPIDSAKSNFVHLHFDNKRYKKMIHYNISFFAFVRFSRFPFLC